MQLPKILMLEINRIGQQFLSDYILKEYYIYVKNMNLFSSRGAREQPEIREAESSTQGVRFTFFLSNGLFRQNLNGICTGTGTKFADMILCRSFHTAT